MDERWYERHAWIYFALVAVVGLVGAIGVWLSPGSGESLFDGFGLSQPAAIAADPEATRYVEHVFEWSAISTIGLDLFALLIAATAFRRGERWAWAAFWFWPAMFASHFVLYDSAFRYAQLVWLVLAVLALAATARKAWAPTTATDPTPVPTAGAAG